MTAIPAHRMLAATGIGLCLALVLHAPAAGAATQRTINLSATSVCEAPLPVFNVHLRKRPVAVQNESDRPVFVSCTLQTDTAGHWNTGSVEVTFTSFGVATTVNCTMVSGYLDNNMNYVPQQLALPADARAVLAWTQVNKGNTSGTYAFSCNLPPGVAMETISYTQTDNNGRV